MPMYSARTSLYNEVRETAHGIAAKNRNAAIRSAADDIANDVVVALARKQQDQPGFVPDNPAAWATTVTKNRIIDYIRSLERDAGNVRPDDAEGDDDGNPAPLLQGALPLDDSATAIALNAVAPARVSAAGGNAVLLQHAMRELGWNSREYLLMALVADEVPYADIAERMDYRNADTVKTMVARLRREAKAVLGDPRDWKATPGPGGARAGRAHGPRADS